MTSPDYPKALRAPAERTNEDLEAGLRDVLGLLRMRTGRDFSSYKRATMLRRIARRMRVNGVEDIHGYASFLRTHPGEAGALLQDLFISVTSFFRDREALDALDRDVITSLFAGKQPTDQVRVWVPACATGEEAYSIAMLLCEHAETLDAPPSIQVFGSDSGEEEIQAARFGAYPESITTDVSEERLRRFFARETNGYRVRRELREVILFATHDVLEDPPFSRLDLIACRNLVARDTRLQEIFHFALKPGGTLFRNASEIYVRPSMPGARDAGPREPSDELQAHNEELQSLNEELRSTTEELKSSREELQSMNEELTTVNRDMKARMDAFATTNADLQNLLSATSIATVFLDTRLAIMRYTPLAADVFHLIPSDVGRPLAHLKSELDYPELIADAEKVHDTLVPIEREIAAGTSWFLARLQPYRTLDNRIGGVVLTLVDVTERNRAREAMRLSEARLKLIIESAKDYAIIALDPERRVESWSAGAALLFGFDEMEVVGKLVDELFTAAERSASVPQQEMDAARATGSVDGARWYTRKDGRKFFGSGATVPLREGGGIQGYVTIIRDLTTTKHTQDELRERADELARFNAAAVGREERMIDLKKEINALAARLGERARYKVAD